MPRPTSPSVTAAELDGRSTSLRAAGLSYREIGRQLGISPANAHKRVTRALDRTRREPADALRELELERLDALQVHLTQVLRRHHVTISGGKVVRDEDGQPYRDDGPTVAAAQALVRIQESRRKLLGLDAPVKVDAKVMTVDEIDMRIRELEAQLGETADPGSLYERNRQKAIDLFDQVAEHAGVDYPAERDACTRAVAFRQAWRGRPLGDATEFVAQALELAIDLLDLSEKEQEMAAAAVERFLQQRAGHAP